MNIKEAQEIVNRVVSERKWETPSSDTFIHLVEELGEIARNILKMKNYGGQHTSDSKINLDEELADVFYLLLKLSNENNVDLDKALEKKIEEISKRFPPVNN